MAWRVRDVRNNAADSVLGPKTNVQGQPAAIKGYQHDKSYSARRGGSLDWFVERVPREALVILKVLNDRRLPKTISVSIADRGRGNGTITRKISDPVLLDSFSNRSPYRPLFSIRRTQCRKC